MATVACVATLGSSALKTRLDLILSDCRFDTTRVKTDTKQAILTAEAEPSLTLCVCHKTKANTFTWLLQW